MAIRDLFNTTCSWKRKTTVSLNNFREPVYDEVTIGSDVDCRVEKHEIRDLIEHGVKGDANRAYFFLYLEPSEDILPHDIVVIDGSDNYVVRDVDDAAGHDHHLEVTLEQVKRT